MFNYYNIELEKLKPQPQHKEDHQSKLSLKDATTDDVSTILDYLNDHPTMSSYTEDFLVSGNFIISKLISKVFCRY